MQSGGHGVGGTRHALLDKLNERLAYIQMHRIKRSSLPPAEQTRTNTVEDAPELTEVQARVVKIRELIAQESTGSRGGYSEYAQKKNARLNRMLDEILRDPSRQIYRDRSRGGIEVLRGIEAVERIMADEIRDADNPIR